jgi:hypothetical protein
MVSKTRENAAFWGWSLTYLICGASVGARRSPGTNGDFSLCEHYPSENVSSENVSSENVSSELTSGH